MSAQVILLASLFLAVPISLKYLLAFETRNTVVQLKRQEGTVKALSARLIALDREHDVVSGAILQVHEQSRWAETRARMVEEELTRVRSRRVTPHVEPRISQPLAAAAEAHA